jgi:sigma-E factor negative regulatory protein RseC
MIEQEAVVVRVEGGQAFVEVGRDGGCGRCHETGGCQNGILGQLFGSRPRLYRIANGIGAMPGDRVVVGIAEGATLRAAVLTYVLPLSGLLTGAVAASTMVADGDAPAVLGAIVGLAIGVLAGLTLYGIGGIAQPVLLRRNISCHLIRGDCG